VPAGIPAERPPRSTGGSGCCGSTVDCASSRTLILPGARLGRQRKLARCLGRPGPSGPAASPGDTVMRPGSRATRQPSTSGPSALPSGQRPNNPFRAYQAAIPRAGQQRNEGALRAPVTRVPVTLCDRAGPGPRRRANPGRCPRCLRRSPIWSASRPPAHMAQCTSTRQKHRSRAVANLHRSPGWRHGSAARFR